jgi:hypothetical protein
MGTAEVVRAFATKAPTVACMPRTAAPIPRILTTMPFFRLLTTSARGGAWKTNHMFIFNRKHIGSLLFQGISNIKVKAAIANPCD